MVFVHRRGQRLVWFGVLLIVLSITGSLQARSTRVSHGIVTVDLPGSWRLQRGATLTARAADGKSQVLFVGPVAAGEDASAYMRRGVRAFEKNRKVLKTYPAAPRPGRTRSGKALTFWSMTSRGSGGDLRYAAYYIYTAGGRHQTVIFLTGDERTFQTRLKPISVAMEAGRVTGAANVAGGGSQAVAASGPIKPLRGRALANYNVRLQHPSGWAVKRGRIGGETLFEFPAKGAGFQTQGRDGEIQAALEIQPVAARDPDAALLSFLTKRADVGLHRYRVHKIRSWKKSRARAGRIAAGRYAGFVLDFQKDNRILMAGVALVNPANDTTLLIGTGMLIHEYDRRSHPQRVAADLRTWSRLYDQLLGMAASARWSGAPPRDPGREAWLANKRTLRFSKSRSVSSGSTGAFFSTQAAWDFGSGGSVRYKIDRTRSFVDNSYDLYGRPDFSSGYGGNGRGGSARYEVRRQGNRHYLSVIYPSGAGSLHQISFAPFAIDGLRDGCCR